MLRRTPDSATFSWSWRRACCDGKIPSRLFSELAEAVALLQARLVAMRCRCRLVKEWQLAAPWRDPHDSGEEEMG